MKKLISVLLIIALAIPFAGCKVETTVDNTTPTQVKRETMGRISETVLYHKDGIKVTATKLEQTINGGTIHVTMVNNTELPVSMASDDIIVNGITVTDGYCIEAPANSTASGKIDISYRSMDNAHITNIAYIESPDARIFENVEFTTLDTASFRIETSIAADYAQVYPEAGNTIYDKNGIKVQILGCVAGNESQMPGSWLRTTQKAPSPLSAKIPPLMAKPLPPGCTILFMPEQAGIASLNLRGLTTKPSPPNWSFTALAPNTY